MVIYEYALRTMEDTRNEVDDTARPEDWVHNPRSARVSNFPIRTIFVVQMWKLQIINQGLFNELEIQ